MRVLVALPLYDQEPLPAGAFVTTREYVRGLVTAGHAVQVVTTVRDDSEPRTVDGVQVWPLRYWRRAVRAARPELLITHHGDRKAARIVAQTPGVAHLLMVHGMSENRELGSPGLVWFPSWACRSHYPAYRGRVLVLPPPIDPARYRTTPGRLVTLTGTTDAKGVDVLAAVAERMPGDRFLAVRTAGRQDPPMPRNVEFVDRTDPRAVYARTRVLLMPSVTESYGRAGVEAMLSGIPVLAAPLPGMREAFGDSAVYVPREDTGRWVEEIRRLDDPGVYAAASARARAHADALDHEGSLAAFEAACVGLLPAPVRPRGPRRATAPAAPPVGALRPAQVVAWVHFGVPYRRAGSETMLHTMMRALADAGRDVLVVCSAMEEAPATWHVDGVPYASLPPDAAEAAIRAGRPRAVVTHHDFAERAITLARGIGARSVLLVHSDFDLPARALAFGPDLCVYNTEWVRASLTGRYPETTRGESIVVRPPVLPGEHRAPVTGDRVTLVNLNRDKGVETWRGAAAALRRLPFLGVQGAHGRQVLRPILPNMRIIPQTSNMRRDVWARTRVLLMPSVYESYGMAGVEALASGIPVIAHPTPGLREALGEAGVFVDRADVPAWAREIRALYRDGDRRAEACAAAAARSAFLADQARTELDTWVQAVEGLL
ncbi:glycosyltransferase [Streptomyces sp. TRM43335]|uniref:D-inositol 3-phosphate glycosyltransferase n=2 Tax=Streptomyces taklimakanensis TaxID=2569853 RepID=A0A6G2BDC7_9ACTN|nr:glycosyltransferase [Streptomyces taklimakanensis]